MHIIHVIHYWSLPGPRNWIRFIVGSDLWTVIFILKLWINVWKQVLGCSPRRGAHETLQATAAATASVSYPMRLNSCKCSFCNHYRYVKRRRKKETKRATAAATPPPNLLFFFFAHENVGNKVEKDAWPHQNTIIVFVKMSDEMYGIFSTAACVI